MATGDDQSKRTMAALERRFALAKAEMQPRERRNNNRKPPHRAKSFTNGPSSALSSMAANAKSAASRRDPEADEPIYFPISQPVNANLIAPPDEESPKGKNEVDRVLHELLQAGDSAQKYNQGSKSLKMDNYILLDNFVNKSASNSSCSLRTRSKRSRKRVSMRKLKKLGSFDLPDEFRKFDLFLPMHDLWKSYLIQTLKCVGRNQVAQHLMNADLHGAILRVVECNVDSLIGVFGIMIRETKETFGIVTREDRFKVVIKKGSVFMLQADCWSVTLFGDKLTSRNFG